MLGELGIVGYVTEGLARRKKVEERKKSETAYCLCFEAKAHAIEGQTRS